MKIGLRFGTFGEQGYMRVRIAATNWRRFFESYGADATAPTDYSEDGLRHQWRLPSGICMVVSYGSTADDDTREYFVRFVGSGDARTDALERLRSLAEAVQAM